MTRRSLTPGILVIAALTVAGCTVAPGQPGRDYGVFTTEYDGFFDGGKQAANEAIWTLQAEAAEACPQGYDWRGVQKYTEAHRMNWTLWVRCQGA